MEATLLAAITPELRVWLALGGLVVVLAVGMILSRDKGRMPILQRLAARLGGTVVRKNFIAEPRIEFSLAGRAASLRFFGGSRGAMPYSRVTVDLRGKSPGILHILEEDFGEAFLKLFGAQDLSIGDADFDKKYVIKATPESLATRVFAPERRSGVIQTIRRLEGTNIPSFSVDAEQARVTVCQVLRKEEPLMTLVLAATEFVDHLGAVAEVGGEKAVQAGEACPVCGTGLNGAIVRCERCGTPHHAPCWKHVGHCSKFGCPGTRAAA